MCGGRWLIAQTKFDCLVSSVQGGLMLTLAPRLSSTLSPGGAMPAAEVVSSLRILSVPQKYLYVSYKYLRQVVTRIVRDVEEQHERRRGWVRRCDHMKQGVNITSHLSGTNLPHRGHLEQLRIPAGLWLLQQPGTARSFRHNDDDDDDDDDDGRFCTSTSTRSS